MHAPVRVAMSTIASFGSSVARTRASAITRRPSASVLITSTVVPPRIVITSPNAIAVPDGMLSVHIRNPVTWLVQPRSASCRHRGEDRRRARHVVLHLGVDLVARLEGDPAGVVHDPLADERQPPGRLADAGRYVSLIIRGGSALPWLTPSRPPQPISTRASLSKTSTSRPRSPPRAIAISASPDAFRWLCGVLARSRASWVAAARARPRSAPAATACLSAASATMVSPVDVGALRLPPQRVRSGSGPAAPPRPRPGPRCSGASPDSAEGEAPTAVWLPAARANAAAALRSAGGVELTGVADADGHGRGARRARYDEGRADRAVEPGRLEPAPVEADLGTDRTADAHRHPDRGRALRDRGPRHRSSPRQFGRSRGSQRTGSLPFPFT